MSRTIFLAVLLLVGLGAGWVLAEPTVFRLAYTSGSKAELLPCG